jgi:hypothetical protein
MLRDGFRVRNPGDRNFCLRTCIGSALGECAGVLVNVGLMPERGLTIFFNS